MIVKMSACVWPSVVGIYNASVDNHPVTLNVPPDIPHLHHMPVLEKMESSVLDLARPILYRV